MHQLRTLLFIVAVTFIGLTSPASAEKLSGTVKVLLPDGLSEDSGDGSIVFRVRRKNQSTISVEGRVEAGHFSVDLPLDSEFQVLATRTSAGNGYPVGRGLWISAPDTGTLHVIVQIPLDFDLWVYGADGKTQLKNISVMRSLRKFARLSVPGPSDSKTHQIFTTVDSPITFHIDSPETYTYYVHAPGHSWTQITPDPHLGGVQTLLLPEGGSLEIDISQAGPGRGKVLRIRDLDPAPDTHPLVHELKRYGAKVQVVGLPVGRYSVSSEDPIRPWNMPVYGSSEIEIQAAQTTSLQLSLSAEPVFQPVPAGGTVHIPSQWGRMDQLVLKLDRLDPYGNWGRSFRIPGSSMTPMAGYADVYQWSLPEVAPGAYNLSFEHTSFSVYREIHGAGNMRMHLELPAPRTVRVSTVDDRTGNPIHPESLTWSAMEPEAIRKKIRDTAPFRSERRFISQIGDETAFSIYGPDAPLRIRLADPRFDMAELVVDGAGDQQVTWSIHRATGIRLNLRHSGQTIAWKGNVHILSESGHGKVLGALDSKTGHQYNLSSPGRYSIRFPALEGYQPIPPQTVQVEDGEILVVEVDLISS